VKDCASRHIPFIWSWGFICAIDCTELSGGLTRELKILAIHVFVLYPGGQVEKAYVPLAKASGILLADQDAPKDPVKNRQLQKCSEAFFEVPNLSYLVVWLNIVSHG